MPFGLSNTLRFVLIVTKKKKKKRINQTTNIYINASQSSVARLSCQDWDASTDQPEKVPAESACLSGPSHPSPVALAPPMKKQQGVLLGAGSGLVVRQLLG